MRALRIAAAGMAAQQTRVEVISNNLANMSTTGYNARRAEFADLHYQQLQRPGTINASDGTVLPTGVQLGVRRQGFWNQWQLKLSESLAHLVGFIMRRAVGDASAALRVSFV